MTRDEMLALTDAFDDVVFDYDGLHHNGRTVMQWSNCIPESEREHLVRRWPCATEAADELHEILTQSTSEDGTP